MAKGNSLQRAVSRTQSRTHGTPSALERVRSGRALLVRSGGIPYGGRRMRESRMSGSVEGVAGDGHPYSDFPPSPKEGYGSLSASACTARLSQRRCSNRRGCCGDWLRPFAGRGTLARIIRKGSDFGSQDGVIVSRTKDRTLPLSSAGHVGRKIGRMARCERPAGQLRRGRSREAR